MRTEAEIRKVLDHIYSRPAKELYDCVEAQAWRDALEWALGETDEAFEW